MESLQDNIVKNETDKNLEENKIKLEDNILINCLRKKYKCIILWLLAVIIFAQIFVSLIEKINSENLNSFFNIFLNEKNNSINLNLINNLENLINILIDHVDQISASSNYTKP